MCKRHSQFWTVNQTLRELEEAAGLCHVKGIKHELHVWKYDRIMNLLKKYYSTKLTHIVNESL